MTSYYQYNNGTNSLIEQLVDKGGHVVVVDGVYCEVSLVVHVVNIPMDNILEKDQKGQDNILQTTFSK